MTLHYQSSNGPKLIAVLGLPYPYLLNARDKLVREDEHGLRQAEVDAMSARLAEIEAMSQAEAEL